MQWVIHHRLSHGINWSEIQHRIQSSSTRIVDVESATSFQQVHSEQLQLLQTQHVFWLQRAKLKSDILDGLPSRFLYSRVKQRSSHQRILALRSVSGKWLFEPDLISLEITSFFQELLCSTPPQDPASPRGFIEPLLESLDLPQLSSADCLVLSAPFTATDIIHALNGMDGSKSPGPDGITFWPQVGYLVTMALLHFLNSGVMLKEWNNTHIILIPKVDKPELISQYRPISLCNVIYRLASKCLANRLKLVISSIVSDSQQAFVPSRLISDGCLITHEIMHYLNKTNKGTVSYAALKLDMHKAFDRVSWPFLIAIMKKFGFPQFWQNIIWECISTLRAAEKATALPGLKISRYAPPITHLFYADDAFICCKATPTSFETLRDLFRCFELASGQMINLDKSFIKFSPNAPADFMSHMSFILKMKTSDSFGNYLGVPVDLSSKKSLRPREDGGLGLKSVSMLSQASLMKNFWRIHHQPSSLLAKFMLPKYRKDLPVPASRSKVSHPSFLWSGLCRTAFAFAPGFSWKLGNGSSVDLLTSPWVNGTSPSSPCANFILAMEPPHIDIDDFLYWKYTEDGVYTVRSGYDFLLSRISFSCSPSFYSAFPWKVLWGLRFSPKFSLLVWRIVHNILPSLEILSTRGIQLILLFACNDGLLILLDIFTGPRMQVNPFQILHMADYLFGSHSQLPVLWPSFVKNTNKISIFPLDNTTSLSLFTVTYFTLVCRSSPRDRFMVTSSDSISSIPVIQHVRASSVFAASTKGLLLNMYRAHSASLPSVSFQVTSKKLSSVLASTTPVPIELRHSLGTIRSFLCRYVHWSVSFATG
ncbi:uncharacterized protein LOC141618237 [Silene latifolia]|uniref:uncharacterized protein LOC141618237 n=1 Tax=Silene latifolia TaxID=37657 RepID=UPI003D786AE0